MKIDLLKDITVRIKDKDRIITKEDDLLNTYPYVKLIKKVINDESNELGKGNTLRLALYGDWGTGKSTILKTVEENFKESNIKLNINKLEISLSK